MKYTLITMYSDGFTKAETSNNLPEIFYAVSTYIIDNDCTSVICMNNETKEFIIDYRRE